MTIGCFCREDCIFSIEELGIWFRKIRYLLLGILECDVLGSEEGIGRVARHLENNYALVFCFVISDGIGVQYLHHHRCYQSASL